MHIIVNKKLIEDKFKFIESLILIFSTTAISLQKKNRQELAIPKVYFEV